MYVPHVTVVYYPTATANIMTSNYTPDMLRCYLVLDPRAWTMYLISDTVVQGWCCMYWYAIPLFYQCCMRHGQRLPGVNHLTYHIITSNYVPDMITCYPGYRNEELEPFNSISGIVVQEWWYMYWYAIIRFYECYMRDGSRLIGGVSPHRPRHHLRLHLRHAQLLPFDLVISKSLNYVPHQWCSGPRMMAQVCVLCPTV